MRFAYMALAVIGLICCLAADSQAQWRRGGCGSNYVRRTYDAPRAAYAQPRAYAQSERTVERDYSRPAAPEARNGESAASPRTAYRPPTEREPAGGHAEPATRSSHARRSEAGTTRIQVAAHDNYFKPETITVPPGTTIRWTNLGQHYHTVTSDEKRWDSGDMSPETTYEATFRGEGTYRY